MALCVPCNAAAKDVQSFVASPHVSNVEIELKLNNINPDDVIRHVEVGVIISWTTSQFNDLKTKFIGGKEKDF